MREYQITHQTNYKYSAPVAFSHLRAYLRPLSNYRQSVISYSQSILPLTSELTERTDYFGNSQMHFQIDTRHNELDVISHSRVQVSPQPDIGDPACSITCGDLRRHLSTEADADTLLAVQMSSASGQTPPSNAVRQFAAPFFDDDKPFLQAALTLNAAIYSEFQFDNDATDITTPVDEILRLKRGVCQDFAHLMLAAIRTMRLPARYVSGYILTNPPKGKPRMIGADASHAWVSVFVPAIGWVDLDPTNNLVTADQHITVATGRDFDDVSPIRGAVTGGGSQTIRIAVTVMPVEEL
jgi:transglutaminase-like putative cysteine protease